jgi:DNA-binding transcriptional regulator PaaX
MSLDKYNKDDLSRDLFLMVKAGLLDVSMREDGEWVYKVSEAALLLTEEEKSDVLSNLDDYDDID